MVRAQLTSTITMSSRDRSETITSGFAAGLAWPPRVARRAADPVVVMDAPRPCRSTVLRFAASCGRTPATAHLPDGLALSYLILERAGSTHSPRAIETSCDASHCSASQLAREVASVLAIACVAVM